MILIKQHIPDFMPLPIKVLPFKGRCETTEEILDLPWVRAWRSMCDLEVPGSDVDPLTAPRRAWFVKSGNELMVEGIRNGSPWWWVIATIEDPSLLEIPEWAPKYPPGVPSDPVSVEAGTPVDE